MWVWFFGCQPISVTIALSENGKKATGTRAGNSVHISGGNKQVADFLTAFILMHGGQIVFEENVERIILEDMCTYGVETNKGNYTKDIMISDADIRTTVLALTQRGLQDDSLPEGNQIF